MKKLQVKLLMEIAGIAFLVFLGMFLVNWVMIELSFVDKNNYIEMIWISLGLGFIVLVATLFFSIRYSLRQFMKPIKDATEVANHLLQHISGSKIEDLYSDNEVHFTNSISHLTEMLHSLKNVNDTEKIRLETLIENIGSGLVFIDAQGNISLINRTFRNLFNVNEIDLLNKPYYQGLQSPDIKMLIDTVFITEKSDKITVEIPFELENKSFYVAGEPIFSKDNIWKGVLVVYHDISEIKRLENIRKDFVANVSHELKTPITSLKGFAETLLDGAKNDPEILEQFLQIIHSESERLQRIIGDLLELSIVEKDGYQLDIQEVEVVSIVKETFAILHKKAEKRNVALVIDREKEKMFCKADPFRMKQVIINLVSNAISYSFEDSEVIVHLNETEKFVTILVQDFGIGIEESVIPRVFERFYRVDKARSRAQGGTGLGLAIVKHIMEVHNGQISVESEVGKGTTFKVSFSK
ncbi:MAG: sensor histidine kinase [Bacillales bacterium]|jgi:two-component system phosphate regulon sensor histidine kinase PhoR|nr:sensor histidine kinase [Bacillales bacterium]